MKPVIIGSRGSPLALAQTNQVRDSLQKLWPEKSFVVQVIRTQGDVLSLANGHASSRDAVPLSKGLFTGELESALKEGQIDLAIHSLKDLPTDAESHPDLELAAIPKRADPRDVIIYKNRADLEKSGATLATGSPRRIAQLLYRRPDRTVVPVRGNIDTRLRKLRENSSWAGLVLAHAGVDRLGPDIEGLFLLPLLYEEMLPAPGQGALALQIRRGNQEMQQVLAPLHHPDTAAEVTAERGFLRGLGGGCQQPIAAIGQVTGSIIKLEGMAWKSMDRLNQPSRARCEGPVSQANELAKSLARVVMERLMF